MKQKTTLLLIQIYSSEKKIIVFAFVNNDPTMHLSSDKKLRSFNIYENHKSYVIQIETISYT